MTSSTTAITTTTKEETEVNPQASSFHGWSFFAGILLIFGLSFIIGIIFRRYRAKKLGIPFSFRRQIPNENSDDNENIFEWF